MTAAVRWTASLLLLVTPFAVAQEGKLAVKKSKAAPPKELSEPIRKLLADTVLEVTDAGGKTVAEFWLRQEVPADMPAAQVKDGLTYRALKESEILGAVRFPHGWSDYRRQKIKAGVYTLRLGFQPVDGDHIGTSPHQEFLLVLSADKDTKPEPLDMEALAQKSAKSIKTSHPGVLMLFPNAKPAGEPRFESQPNNHLALFTATAVKARDQKVPNGLGLGINLVGHAE